MTRMRASWVCEPTLALCARDIDLGEYVMLGRGEDLTGGRERDSILSDTLEATIGAVYLDGGFEKAKEYIDRHILKDIEISTLELDHSSECLGYSLYFKEEGPDHNKSFTVAVNINGERLTTATGRTKKKAEQSAAYQAILKFHKS